MRSPFAPLAVAAAMLFAASSTFAQSAATSAIEGIVTDASGGVLPGATVVVKSLETNLSRETVTDAGGRYRVSALPPSRYSVSVTMASFEPAEIGNLTAAVGNTVTVDVKLRVGGLQEQVTVAAQADAIDTSRTDVASVVSQQAIENLPINGRRWENFVLLSPGVTNDGGFGLVSYRGISGLYNNNTVDGVDNNQAFFSEARGRTRASYSISQASIQEFQVGISNFSAEFGRAAGGTVNAVTKSGGNEYKGEAFYFRRQDSFMARDPFASFRPDETRQQFGVAVGGPIKRDKAFFFVTYDGQRRNFPYFVTTSNTTFLEQTCTAPGCDATKAFFRNEMASPIPRKGNNNILLAKVDVSLSPKHMLSMQYNRHRWNAPNGVRTPATTSNASTDNGTDVVRTDFGLLRLSSVLSPRLLNEVRIQVGRDFEAQEPNAPGPGTSVSGGFAFGMPDFLPRPRYPDERRYQLLDTLSISAGAHDLKVGVDFNYVREDIINLFQGGGVYSYSSLQNISADCPAGAAGCAPLADANTGRHYSTFTQAFDLRPGLSGNAFFTTTDYNAFVQDNWRVNRRLTLYLGVRYEYQKLPQPGDASVNGIVFTGNPRFPSTTSFHQDKNNFGPRAGFSYDIAGDHRTVVKGGFGLFYGRTSNSVLFTALTNNAVTTATYVFTPSTAGAPQYPATLSGPPTTPGSRPSISTLSPDLEQPEIWMGDLKVERSLGKNVAVSASYLYSKGTKLPVFIDTNLPEPNSQVTYRLGTEDLGTFPAFRGTRPDTTIGRAIDVQPIADTQYHALVLQARKRFSGGLLLDASYTLSKSTDSGQNSTTFISTFSNVVNPFNPSFEQGTSNFDRRHRFVTSFHYAPAFARGFQIGGVGTFESGLPVTGTISGSLAAGVGAVDTSTTNGSGASNRVPFEERNSFRQKGRSTIDLRMSKTFKLGGRRQIVALWEAFNVLNKTNFTGYSAIRYRVGSSTYDAATNLITVNLTEDAGFLTPNAASNTIFGARDMQLGLKFLF